jgi:Mn-dependent DtxR family transcriptional regulator
LTQTEIDFSKGAANPRSAKAHEVLKPRKANDRLKVWLIIHEAGKSGITLEAIAARMNKYPHQVSGRVSELRKQGIIFVKSEEGLTREGNACAVYVA